MPRWLLALPLAVALLAHGLGVASEFVGDDIPDIVNHPVVGGGESLTDVFRYNFMGDELGEGPNTLRPLATLHFALEWRVFGNRPALFHAVSILWFVLLVAIARRLIARVVSPVASIWGASLFAALAVHVDAVGLVANRPEVCSLVFALLALGAAIDGRAARSVAFYLVALLFKESAFLIPLIAAWWMIAIDGPASMRWSRRGKVVGALLLCAVGFFVIRSALLPVDISAFVIKADNPLLGEAVTVRLWMPFVLLGEYLQLTVLPTDLAFDYAYSAIPVDSDVGRSSGWLGVAISIAVASVMAACLFARGRSKRLRALAAVLGGFALSYALFSNSVFLIVTIFAERLFLAPSFYLCCALAIVGVWVSEHIPTALVRKIAAVIVAAIIAMQASLSVMRTKETADRESLLRSQVAAQPDSVKGRLYYARVLAQEGKREEAVWHLAIASMGRNKFPVTFEAPDLDHRPIAERLAKLPSLLAPDVPPQKFWPAFRLFAIDRLGSDIAPTIDRLME